VRGRSQQVRIGRRGKKGVHFGGRGGGQEVAIRGVGGRRCNVHCGSSTYVLGYAKRVVMVAGVNSVCAHSRVQGVLCWWWWSEGSATGALRLLNSLAFNSCSLVGVEGLLGGPCGKKRRL